MGIQQYQNFQSYPLKSNSWNSIITHLYTGTPTSPRGLSSITTPSFSAGHLPSSLLDNAFQQNYSITIESFFTNFHAQHPFLLPRPFLLKILNQTSLRLLSLVVQYIGSFFACPELTKDLHDLIVPELSSITLPKNSFSVQALLLFSIGLSAAFDLHESDKYLEVATNMALEIGMHHREFAESNGKNCKVREESWRRTWWELYVIQGLSAGTCTKHNFTLFAVNTDVFLPCDEWQYMTGVRSLVLNLESPLS